MQNAQDLNNPQSPAAMRAPLPLREDTILGICEGLGEELGFNPLWLRVALSAGLLWNPYAVVSIYLGLGLVVAAGRLLFPRKTLSLAAAAPQSEAAPQASPTDAREDQSEDERELIAA